MTTALATPLLTAEEFCDWVQLSENRNKWFELVRGRVIELPPPTKVHGCVCANIARILGNYTFARRKGYVTTNDSGVILSRHPDTVRGPDVALYEDASRFSELHPKYGEVPPRLAVEVLSPNDLTRNVLTKTAEYLASGVDLVWVVDPEGRVVTVCQQTSGPRQLREHDELDGGDILPGFRCQVADFFYLPGSDTPPQG